MGQEILVDANNEPLNNLLIKIAEAENIQFSFNDEQLSKVIICHKDTFPNIEEALQTLLKSTDLLYECIDNVWIIYPIMKEKYHTISGDIIDINTNEALPYSHILINGWPTISNQNGRFSYSLLEVDTICKITVSYLGYYILDTIVQISQNLSFELTPSSIGLTEIIICDKIIEKSYQFGGQPGLIKLNHKISHFLPGYGDNSIFNLIRLMPGILASGEQTSELIIWGGYAGQSEVKFDGFTVFGLKNFNDNISSFNPLMAKDVEIYKGGYDARFGGRVGGIVNIIGKNGNTKKPSFVFNINNMTLNGFADIPLSKSSSLILAFRHTYYNLYNPSDMTGLFSKTSIADSSNTISIIPDYLFRDANLKYSKTFKNNDIFFVSLHAGEDKFNYHINEPVINRIIEKKTSENNLQVGGSTYYSHNWSNGSSSDILFSYSSLSSEYKDDFKIKFPMAANIEYKADDKSNNQLEEYSIKFSNSITPNRKHNIKTGINFIHNMVMLDEYSFSTKTSYYFTSANRFSFFVQDELSVNQRFHVKVGLRAIHSFNINNTYLEPRFSAVFRIGDHWKINSAIGVYNQFISLSTIYDDFGNYKYFWTIADGNEIPVLHSNHFVLGTKYFKNDLLISLEGYYKSIDGLTRFYNLVNYNIQDIFYGTATGFGIDVLIKKDFHKHSAWIAYSLGKTTESFQYQNLYNIRPAPQDQRHELKLATMLNFDPIFCSSTYIYGSGFPYENNMSFKQNVFQPYSRLDISIIYKFLDRKLKGETGISVLNVLNTKNLKYESFEKIPRSQTTGINIVSEALPITPTFFLKIWL